METRCFCHCCRYNGTYSAHGTHISFLSSTGTLVDSLPCGMDGARLVCTTCGRDASWLATQGSTPSLSRADVPVIGWLKTAVWIPSKPGLATVAVGVAHNGLGTPAVTITRVLVDVVSNASHTDNENSMSMETQGKGKGNGPTQVNKQLKEATEAEARLWHSSLSLSEDVIFQP